jgi:hypothetical protein
MLDGVGDEFHPEEFLVEDVSRRLAASQRWWARDLKEIATPPSGNCAAHP